MIKVKESVSNIQVMQSTDYSNFTFSEDNRPVKMENNKRKELASDIAKRGQLVVGTVDRCLKTGKYIIVDGQHRFEACKTAKVPFIYMFKPGSLKDMYWYQDGDRVNWSQKNKIDHYTTRGNINYKRLRDLLDTSYLGFEPKVTLLETLLLGKRSSNTKFNQGKLVVSQAAVDNYKSNIAPKIKAFVEVIKKDLANSDRKTAAKLISKLLTEGVSTNIVALISSPKYDQTTFINNIKKGLASFPTVRKKNEHAANLVDLYNKGKHKKTITIADIV